MEKKLINAARKGDVTQLQNLIKDDPLLLTSVSISSETTQILHLACLYGHLNFVREILNLNLEFATELNRDGMSPLHIASAKGDLQIVKELLSIEGGSHLCSMRGKDQRTPLHFAVAKGRIHVISELVSVSLESITQVTARGDTCLHLAVKNSQFEAFKVLIELSVLHKKQDLLNMKDQQGNTILHLAASAKKYEVFDVLLDENFAYRGKLELNSLNKRGLTPIDVLALEDSDLEIEEMLRKCGARGNQETMNPQHFPRLERSLPNESGQEQRKHRPSKQLENYFKYDNIKDSPGKARTTLLIIAVLIATATYQAVLSPPGGVWQDDFLAAGASDGVSSGRQQLKPHRAGQAVLGTKNEVSYALFLFFNSIGFFMSLHMMNFVTLGLPMRFELRVSMIALIATYDTCMVAITPSGKFFVMFTVISVLLPIIMPVLTKVVRDYYKNNADCPVN